MTAPPGMMCASSSPRNITSARSSEGRKQGAQQMNALTKKITGLLPILAMCALPAANAAEPAKAAKAAKPAAPRTEHDLLGEKAVPADAYYGVQTARALENFRISGVGMNAYPEFIEGFAMVKLAAARANTKLGAM